MTQPPDPHSHPYRTSRRTGQPGQDATHSEADSVTAQYPQSDHPLPPDSAGPLSPDSADPEPRISAPQTWRNSGEPVTGSFLGRQPGEFLGRQPGEVSYMEFPGISVTSSGVHTPHGSIPLEEARFFLSDRTRQSSSTPTYAVVLAITGFFFITFFSLLFLLIKEQKLTGVVELTVSGAGISYTTSIPVSGRNDIAELAARVQHVQQLTGRAGWA